MSRRALKFLFALTLCLALSLVTSPKLHAQSGLVTLDYPNATETDCNDVNSGGVIVGFYVDNVGEDHGFARINGALRAVNFPRSLGTLLYGVNNTTGVGWYTDNTGIVHGFSVDTQGNLKTLDVPGATSTNAWSINASGQIVGTYTDSSGAFHGFLFSNGKYTSYDAPNSILTEILGINDRGDIVGIFDDSSTGQEHGFALPKVGKFIQIDYPGSGVMVTATDRINRSGEIVGLWGTSSSGPFNGYIAKGGTFHNVTFPNSTETRVRGLNDNGEITGRYTDQSGVVHGMYGTP